MKKSLVMAMVVLSAAGAFAEGKFSPLGVSISQSAYASQDNQFPGRSDSVYGWRLALFSGAHRGMYGLATAVFVNADADANGDAGGLQIASLFNTAYGAEIGLWQLAAFHNSLSNSGNGFQLCAFHNSSGGYFNGVQISIYNQSTQDMAGMQVGVVNRARSMYGVQIGVLNNAYSLVGAQLGLINIVQDSQMVMFPIVRIGW